MKGIFKQTGTGIKLLQLVGVVLFMIVIAALLTSVFTNGDMNSVKTLKQMQLIQSILLFVVPPFILAFLWSDAPAKYLKISTPSKLTDYLLVVALMLCSIPVVNLLAYLNQQIILPDQFHALEQWMRSTEKELERLTYKMLQVNTIKDLIFNMFLIAVLAGLGEELFFRGIIQRILSDRLSPALAIWITAFIFSAIHMQFYGFIPRLLLGAMLGYLLYWSDDLWMPILAHTINNGVAVVYYYLTFNGYKVIDIETIGTGTTIYAGIISVILTAGILYVIYRRRRTPAPIN